MYDRWHCIEFQSLNTVYTVYLDVSLWSDVHLFQMVFDVGFRFPFLFRHSLSEFDTQLEAEERSRLGANDWRRMELRMLISISLTSSEDMTWYPWPLSPDCHKTEQKKTAMAVSEALLYPIMTIFTDMVLVLLTIQWVNSWINAWVNAWVDE